MILVALLAIFTCAGAAVTTCAYSVPECGVGPLPVMSPNGSGGPAWCSCCEMCGDGSGAIAPCQLGNLSGCIGGAISRGGFGAYVEFEHAGTACGSIAAPCRIVSVSTDVLAATTDLTIGQAECALIFDVRTGPPPADDSDDRRAGLVHYSFPGVFCFDGAPLNFSVVATASHADGIRGVMCQPLDTCTTLFSSAGAVPSSALPWNPSDSVAFGDAVGTGGRSSAAVLRVLTAMLVFPDGSGGSVLPVPAAIPGAAACTAPAADQTDEERIRTSVVNDLLRRLGADALSSGIDACNGAMAAITAGASGWKEPLLASLASAEAWAADALPKTAQDALRFHAAENGFIIAAAVGFGALVTLTVGALAIACSYANGRVVHAE